MRRLILILFLIILVQIGSSQTIRLSFEPGYGFYDMGKLHQIQKSAAIFYPELGIKEVEKFPPFFNQNGSICWYATPDFLVGITAGYLSTGARNSVKDYSGEYKLDMPVSATLYGLEVEYNFKLLHNLKYFLNLKAGKISSIMNVTENFTVSNTVLLDDTTSLKEINLFMEPSTGIRYCFSKSFSLSMGVGYLIDSGANKDKYFNWSGWEFKTGIAYSF